MKIYLGADHRGFELKQKIKNFLRSDFAVEDQGAYEKIESDDYPIYAKAVAEKVSKNRESRGILFCGSGVGVDIVANRFPGVRSGLAINSEQIKSARKDDDINVLAIASDSTDFNKTKELVKSFLETPFENSEKHTRRIEETEELG